MEQAIVLYHQGLSIRKIASQLATTYYRVRRYLIEQDIHKPTQISNVCSRCSNILTDDERKQATLAGNVLCNKCIRIHARKYNSGSRLLSEAEYQKMYQHQGGRCYICNTLHNILAVDHNHNTMQVRGLLCNKCNRGLGFFGDDIKLLLAAVDYLRKN